MAPEPAAPCIFCGSLTYEELDTSIGTVFVHLDCLVMLEVMVTLLWEEYPMMDGWKCFGRYKNDKQGSDTSVPPPL